MPPRFWKVFLFVRVLLFSFTKTTKVCERCWGNAVGEVANVVLFVLSLALTVFLPMPPALVCLNCLRHAVSLHVCLYRIASCLSVEWRRRTPLPEWTMRWQGPKNVRVICLLQIHPPPFISFLIVYDGTNQNNQP